MYKIVGIFCILAGCMGLGRLKVRQERERIRHLREWIRIIRRMQDEISYGKHTLPEICLILADNVDGWYAPYFKEIHRQMLQGDGTGLKEVWEDQMGTCLQNLPLQEEERDIIRQLPACLGLQEETRQALGFEQAVSSLTGKCQKAEEAYENRSKMIHSVSILAGLLLSILLL